MKYLTFSIKKNSIPNPLVILKKNKNKPVDYKNKLRDLLEESNCPMPPSLHMPPNTWQKNKLQEYKCTKFDEN